ncbi:MAG: T9SS type A sorting domain-containing protein [Saprospiraceae bacterium]
MQKITDLQTINAAITPEGDYQENERDINTIYLMALAQNDWTFNSEEQAVIDAIAVRCPQFGGNAVYTARFLQEHYRKPYWNMGDCLVEERGSGPLAVEKMFSLSPNPASDQLQIQLNQPLQSEATVEIADLTGRVIMRQKMPENSPMYSVQTGELQTGTYYLRIFTDSQLLGIEKIIIAN